MNITITLKEQVKDIIYTRIIEEVKDWTRKEILFQKYFYSKGPPTKPALSISCEKSIEQEFVLRRVIFKSGREGFSGISYWDNLIIRANISHNEKDEPLIYLLTCVLEKDFNYNNNEENYEYDNKFQNGVGLSD